MEKINITEIKNKTEFAHFLSLYAEVQDKKPTKKILHALEADFFSARPPFIILLACTSAEPVGFMILTESYSSTLAHKTVYLEEFYIKKEYQKHGFGRKLFQHLIRFSKKCKYARIEWATHRSNRQARSFYKKYPANSENIFYKLDI